MVGERVYHENLLVQLRIGLLLAVKTLVCECYNLTSPFLRLSFAGHPVLACYPLVGKGGEWLRNGVFSL